jgi:nickel-type superoxide dismutase maturation protease
VSLIPFGLASVRGASMVPTYHDGDRLLVRYGAAVRSGDPVIARDPRDPSLVLVKRAVRKEPAGWWLLADNPYASGDSRQFGPVAPELILGRVVARLTFRPRRRPARPASSA